MTKKKMLPSLHSPPFTRYSFNMVITQNIHPRPLLHFLKKKVKVLKIQVQIHFPSNFQALKELVPPKWIKTGVAICPQLVQYMLRRVGAAFKNHGGYSKY